MTDLKGKWALVTGAARGIGCHAAVELAERGVNLVLQSRDTQHCEKVLEEVKARGVDAYALAAELSDEKSIAAMLGEIDKKGTPIDVILNNAGMQIAYRDEYCSTPASDYTISFMINTTAPMMICYHFLPKMIKNGFGRIVNTTSGIRLEPEQAGYSAAKAALDKVTIDIGSKLEGSNVMINLADPGWCRTDLGGPKAPNSPESAIPGVIVGAFIDDRKSGRLFTASDYYGLTVEQAVEKAEKTVRSPY